MEKSIKPLLALALLFSAFVASTEGGREVPGKEGADTNGPLHTMTFGALFPWAWWTGVFPWGGGSAQGTGTGNDGGLGGLGAFLSWLAGHPWFAGHPWLGRFAGYGGGTPAVWKMTDQDDVKKGNIGTGGKYP